MKTTINTARVCLLATQPELQSQMELWQAEVAMRHDGVHGPAGGGGGVQWGCVNDVLQ